MTWNGREVWAGNAGQVCVLGVVGVAGEGRSGQKRDVILVKEKLMNSNICLRFIRVDYNLVLTSSSLQYM